MRIVSDFKDYYDCIAYSGGYDPLPLYIRKEKLIREKCWSRGYLIYNPTFSLDTFTIDFCGNVYFGLCLHICGYDNKSFHYSQDSVAKYLMKNLKDKYYDEYCKKLTGWPLRSNHSYVGQYFHKNKPLSKTDYNNPIIINYNEDGYLVTINNGILRKFEFAKLKDPYTCYQELEQYLSSLAVPLKDMKEPNNEDKISLHGFDKFSFRKDKSK